MSAHEEAALPHRAMARVGCISPARVRLVEIFVSRIDECARPTKPELLQPPRSNANARGCGAWLWLADVRADWPLVRRVRLGDVHELKVDDALRAHAQLRDCKEARRETKEAIQISTAGGAG